MTKRIVLALGAVSIVLAFAFVVAYWSHVLNLAPVAVSHTRLEAPSPRPEARKIPSEPFVATEIGVAYHRTDAHCFYIEKQSRHTLIPFKTRAEAEASGRHACTNCLPSIASSQQPPPH